MDACAIDGPLPVDLNTDGVIDLVARGCSAPCTPCGERQALVRMNDGHGVFGDSIGYPVEWRRAIVPADVDGDLDLDLVFPGGLVSILINTGDGTFGDALEQAEEFGTPSEIQDSILADLDGDAVPDLAAVDGESLITLRDRGVGSSFDRQVYPARVGGGARLQAIDLRNAGWLDFLVFGQNGTWVFRNDGNGLFELLQTLPIGFPFDDPLTADLNGDGFLDLVSESVLVLEIYFQRDGRFVRGATHVTGAKAFWISPIAVDMDADGDLDLIAGRDPESGFGRWLENMGGGVFRAPIIQDLGGSVLAMACGDLNGDGKADVAALTSGRQGILVYQGDGKGNFAVGSTYGEFQANEGPDPGRAILLGDLDGDSDLDIVLDLTDIVVGPSVLILRNRGDGAFDVVQEIFQGGRLKLVDLDDDARLDLILLGASILVFPNDGMGRFDEALSAGYSAGTGTTWPAALVVADLNGDGRPDIATADAALPGEVSQGSVSVLLNRGDGRFQDAALRVTDDSLFYIRTADLDGDGSLDIAAAAKEARHVVILKNQGDGSFPEVVPYHLGGEGKAVLEGLEVGPIDGDSAQDILVLSSTPPCGVRCLGPYGPDGVFLLRNDGNGAFLPPVFTGVYAEQFLVGDFDGDLDADVLATRSVGCFIACWSGGISFLQSSGRDGRLEARQSFSLPATGTALPIDVDGDGFVDLVVPSANGIFVLRNETLPPTSLDLNHNSIPDECETSFHRGDPNSSGTIDISDGIAIFGFLFLGDPATLSCRESADTNNSGTIDISDGISLLNWLFTGGPAPAAPGPTDLTCGLDPDPPGSPGDLGCEAYGHCQ